MVSTPSSDKVHVTLSPQVPDCAALTTNENAQTIIAINKVIKSDFVIVFILKPPFSFIFVIVTH